MVFIEGINNIVFIEDFHRRQVIGSIHVTITIHTLESQNLDGVEDGTQDAKLSITKIFCMNLIKTLKLSNENDFFIVLHRL